MGMGPTQGPGSGKAADKVGLYESGLFEKCGVYNMARPPPPGSGLQVLCVMGNVDV